MNYQRKQTQQEPAKKVPTLHAFVVKDGKGDGQKGFWTKIGTAWAHEDGEGFSIVLDALPIDGRIVLRAPKSDE